MNETASHPACAITGTPFHPRTAPLNLNQRWVAWDRYHMVDVFSGVDAEYRAIREAAVTIDMTPLGKCDVRGPDAGRFMNHIMTRDMSQQQVGQIFYSPWCNADGRLVGDGMVIRTGEESFRLSADPMHHWLRMNAGGFDVEIIDVSARFAILALQGPRSREVLEAASGSGWSDLPFSRSRSANIGGVKVDVMRQGFTGEHGYELWVEAADAPSLWDSLYKEGGRFGLTPAGFHAHDVARMEAGLIIVGPDYTGAAVSDGRGAALQVDTANVVSPYEVRLGRFVDLKKADFIGRAALLREHESGSTRRMAGLRIDWRGIAELFEQQGLPPVVVPKPLWYPLPISHGERPVGRATSVAWSPALKSIAGFCIVDRACAGPGTALGVEFTVGERSAAVDAVVVELPFIRLKRGG